MVSGDGNARRWRYVAAGPVAHVSHCGFGKQPIDVERLLDEPNHGRADLSRALDPNAVMTMTFLSFSGRR
jgi:hypothetical protein